MAEKAYRSEDEAGLKLDRCVADTMLKVAGGLAIGVVVTAAFFKGRTAPIWLGAGIGLGAGWENCRHDLNKPYLLHGKKVKSGTDANGKPVYQIVVQPPSAANSQ